jgi:hypothetical protein
VATDRRALADLAAFARAEIAAADIEPWAAVIGATRTLGILDGEGCAWLVKLYNAYDDLSSAWQVAARWGNPGQWHAAADTAPAALLPLSGERRNLRGGLVRRHLDAYAAAVVANGGSQLAWLAEAYPAGTPPEQAWTALMAWMRRLWGVGRLTAFEWAEFAVKCLGNPAGAPDGCLWESSGPRESLCRIYGSPRPDAAWLDAKAHECRDYLAGHGAPLPWVDFETVICDFNVMRKGRYYPGQHLAMIRAEIDSLPGHAREELDRCWRAVIPPGWQDIPPGGPDKRLRQHYAIHGTIATPFGTLEAA